MINFNKEDLEAVREIATRMWIDETHPQGIPSTAVNVYYIIKAFCYHYRIELDTKELTRKSTEVVDDINWYPLQKQEKISKSYI